MVLRSAVLALVLGAGALAVAAAGCSSDAVGVDACKSIEEARCRQLPNCPHVQVSPPIWYTAGTAVDACIRYYDTACGHGLASGSDPGQSAVDKCVTAITNNGCDVVAAPESDPACAWLEPPDAGDDGSDAESGSDGDDGG
jgi:hypothetical protein